MKKTNKKIIMNKITNKNKVCKCEDIISFAYMYPELNNHSIIHNNFVFDRIYVNHIADELLIEKFDENVRDYDYQIGYNDCFKEDERFNSDYVCIYESKPNTELKIADVVNTIKKYSIPDNYTIHVKYREIDMSAYGEYTQFCEVNKFCLAQSWDKQEFIYFGCSKCIDYKLLDLFKFSDIPKKHNI